jgi:hypothetical protein
VSTTVTAWGALAELPLSSVADHVTVVVPSGKMPGASFVTGTDASQRSVADAAPRKGEAPWGELEVHSTAGRGGGADTLGAVVSRIENEPESAK